MDIFVFSSSNLTNIWAGVGAKKWAVSMTIATDRGSITKSKNLKVGSLGLIYCSGTQEFTTPFIVRTLPEEGSTIKDVWPEEWGLPFGILPMGSPHLRMHKDEITKKMPSASVQGAKAWNKILYVQPTFSFQSSTVTTEDWAFIFSALGSQTP